MSICIKLLHRVCNFREGSVLWKGADVSLDLCLVKQAEFVVFSSGKLAHVLDTAGMQVQPATVPRAGRCVSSCRLGFIVCSALFQGVDGSCQSRTGWALSSVGDGVTSWKMTSCQAGWVGCPWVGGGFAMFRMPLGCVFMVLLCHTVLHL